MRLSVFKKALFVPVFALLWALSACSGDISYASWCLLPPPLPDVWLEVLGKPSWRFEWIDSDGNQQSRLVSADVLRNVDIFQRSSNPVLAFPCWPERNIPAGVVKPAGALFPLDAQAGMVSLSFTGGVEASFYRELAHFASGNRSPANFDWPRFRELLASDKINEDARRDLWLVDWTAVAEKTVASSFSARRIKPRTTENMSVIIPADGPWIGVSPFSTVYEWTGGKTVILRVSDRVDTFFCAQGIFNVASKVSSWCPSASVPR